MEELDQWPQMQSLEYNNDINLFIRFIRYHMEGECNEDFLRKIESKIYDLLLEYQNNKFISF